MDLGEDTISPPLAYTITNIQREASGNYSCVLTDIANIPYYEPTSTVTVNVQCKFIFPLLHVLYLSPSRSSSRIIHCSY